MIEHDPSGDDPAQPGAAPPHGAGVEQREGLTRRLMDMGADVVNRALVTGVGAVFMTEEGIRNAVGEMRVPKDVARSVIQQAETTKRELFRIVGREVRSFLEQSNISAAIANALADTTVEITTTIRFRRNEDGGVTPDVVSRTSDVRRRVAEDDLAEGGLGEAAAEEVAPPAAATSHES